MILDKIVRQKRLRLVQAEKVIPLQKMEHLAWDSPPPLYSLKAALEGNYPAVIAEIKKASPSKGLLRADFYPEEIAREYQEAGAAALSILTEEDFFLGSPEYIRRIRLNCRIPILRKDFIFSAYQIYESRYLGADGILLIAAMLSDQQLSELGKLAATMGLEVLVEVHNEDELARVLSLDFSLIGINNRDLTTFKEDITTTQRLAALAPEKTLVAESAIRSGQDLAFVYGSGVQGALIGEAFVTQDSPGEALGNFLRKAQLLLRNPTET